MPTNKQTCLLIMITMLNLCAAIAVRPGSGPVSVSPYYSISGNNYCLTFTNLAPVEISLDLPPLEASKNTLVFQLKQETSSDLELTTSGNELGYENINEYLPEKKPKEYWQKVIYPVTNPNRTLYLKLTPNKRYEYNKVYLSEPTWEATPVKTTTKTFKINDFSLGLANRFGAQPEFQPENSRSNLTVTENYLAISFDTTQQGDLYIPIQKTGALDASEYTEIKLLFYSNQALPFRFSPAYAKQGDLNKSALPYTEQVLKITAKQKGWQTISIPLNPDQKNSILGLKIILPIDSKGTFYLDNLYLQ